jgi:acyl dehydratase
MTGAAEKLVTPELRSWIGRKSEVVALEVITASDIRRYVDATGDANPLWLDDDFARAAGYRGRLIPPTLVGWVPFSMKEGESARESADLRRELPVPPDYTNVRNAGAEIEWLEPVYLGERLSSQSVVLEIVARQGRSGIGIYITQEERISNDHHEIVMTRRHTIAIFPARQFAGREEQK